MMLLVVFVTTCMNPKKIKALEPSYKLQFQYDNKDNNIKDGMNALGLSSSHKEYVSEESSDKTHFRK